MSDFKLLIVEDDDRDINVCLDSINVYNKKYNCSIDPIPCHNKEEALDVLDSSFDGAIIDLKLQVDPDAGNEVIAEICKQFRIPIAIMTATPANADEHPYVTICKKGEVGYDKVLDSLLEVHKTGITKILGGRGEIEEAMNKVFWQNILPQLGIWKSYAKNGKQTERALLRFTLNHLMELLEEDSEICFTEEMYINPPISSHMRTGSIVKRKTPEEYYIVLSPACDLTIRQEGKCNTDYYLLCKIESFAEIKDKILNGATSERDKKNRVTRLLGNKKNNYYHWLPKGHKFPSGVINFRQCMSVPKDSFDQLFNAPTLQVSKHFIKDIISRYSAYYARQGQPDFDYESLSNEILGTSTE